MNNPSNKAEKTINKEKISIFTAVRYWLRALGIWIRYAPKMVAGYAYSTLFQATAPFVFIFFQARIVTELAGSRRMETLTHWVILVLSLTTIFKLGESLFKRLEEKYTNTMQTYDNMFADAFLDMHFKDMDDPDLRESYYKLEQIKNYMGMGIYRVWESSKKMFTTTLHILTAIVLSASIFRNLTAFYTTKGHWLLSPWAAVFFLILLSLFSFLAPVFSSMAMKILYNTAETGTAANRLYTTVFDEKRPDEAMEVRVYQQGKFMNWLLRQDNSFSKNGIMAKLVWGPVGSLIIVSLTFSNAALIAAYLYVVGIAWLGAIGIGPVTQYIGAITLLSSGLQNVLEVFIEFRLQANILRQSFDLLDHARQSEDDGVDFTPDLDKGHKITFRNLSFRYPNQGRWALRHVNLEIFPKERLAIAGRNGSGKTTLIKLLCRLYEPDEGEILVDGVPITHYSVDSWRRALSVVFQDAQLFSYTMGDNIAAGQILDGNKACEALEKAGLKLEATPSLKDGLDTWLYKDLNKSGVNLSGGEAQKITIARALYKDSPILIFDEPTAALDPLAEAEIYQHLNNIVGRRTAVFISHRLSSCIFADRIAIFEKGELIQQGQHEILLNEKDGMYAKLWHAQAQYYQ